MHYRRIGFIADGSPIHVVSLLFRGGYDEQRGLLPRPLPV